MSRSVSSLAALFCLVAWPLGALDLTAPTNARETASRDSALAQEAIPTGPFRDGALPATTLEGPVTRRAYRIPSSGLTPLQILTPMRAQLDAAGYDILLDCDQDSCGGFDFRFAINVLPAPNMYVNIRAYHFLSAQQATSGAAVTMLASAASGVGYLQVVQIGTDAIPGPDSQTQSLAPDAGVTDRHAAPQGELTAQLLERGRAVLNTLDFAPGTTTLTQKKNPELAAIAAFMQSRPGLEIAFVGHTDTAGDLEANIAVSRARAEAVRKALIETYGVPAERIEAGGMGYLSPVASNLTAEGREANRRVEVILIREDG